MRRTFSIFILSLALLASTQRSQAQATPAPMPQPSPALIQVETEAVGWLQDLIRINTTNPPGNELAAAKYLAGVLDKEGIRSETFESTPGRGFLVARMNANALPDSAHALLLVAHLDVVGVDKSKWTVDPFGGIIQGSYLYGRGAIDDKGMTAANLATIIELKRTNARLSRDVIFLAEGDEESGGEQGMRFAVEKHWDKIAAGFALNESGRVVLKDGKVQYVGVQASEKVSAHVDVIASGSSGHASVPAKDNPVVHLAAALTKISTYDPPVEFTSITRAYFQALAPVEDEDTAKWIRVLDTPDRGDHAARILSDSNPVWNAMLHNTVTPTMLEGSIRANAIPSQAKAVLDIRLLPGDQLDPIVAKLKFLANDPAIRFDVEPNGSEPAPSSSLTSDLFQSISRVSAREFPGAPVTPYLSPGASDSYFLRMRSVQAYGILPFPLSEEDITRIHGDEERIPVDSFRKGVEFLYNIVTDFAVAK